jgi:predicted RNA binding protein YcfA (HicA-like mRNA interferase family)
MNRIRRKGWAERPDRGSHVVLPSRAATTLPMPNHRGDIPTGTLRSIAGRRQWPPQR